VLLDTARSAPTRKIPDGPVAAVVKLSRAGARLFVKLLLKNGPITVMENKS